MGLRKKKILITSSQPWDSLHISKHHYAMELAKRDNIVYFMSRGNRKDGVIEIKASGVKNIQLICYNDLISGKIRFHFPKVYQFYLRLIVKRILRRIGKSFDIVWSFDGFIFENLKWFKGGLTIFHPVDKVKNNVPLAAAKTADVIFSVAQNILRQFEGNKVPAFFINHGLAEVYADVAERDTIHKENNSISFAYIGNLTMEIIDHNSLIEIIKKYPQINFDFYGKNESIKPSEKVLNFLNFLRESNNVCLKGTYHSTDLSIALKKYDGFLLSYRTDKDPNQGSNSHKILEYLSYGKVIVSSKIIAYEDYSDLIMMSKKENNSDYVELFEKAVGDILFYNSPEKGKMRKELALLNTYFEKVNEVETILKKMHLLN